MNHKVYTVAIVVALGLGVYIGKSQFAKTETVEVEREVVRKDIVTVVKEVVRKDGTRETETITTDKSKEKRDSSSTVTAITAVKPDWHISVSASTARVSEISSPVYGLQIERRILGPFSAGLRVQSDRYVGLVVAYEF